MTGFKCLNCNNISNVSGLYRCLCGTLNSTEAARNMKSLRLRASLLENEALKKEQRVLIIDLLPQRPVPTIEQIKAKARELLKRKKEFDAKRKEAA